MNKLLHPYVLLALAVLFWAGNSVVGRAFSTELPPIGMVFWRWTIAAIILIPICLKPFWQQRHIVRKHIPYIAFQGFLSISAFNTLLYWGLHYTTVVNTSLVQSSMPVVTLFFSILLLRKGVGGLAAMGIVVSILGVSWVVLRGDLQTIATLNFNPGDMIMLVSVVAWSVYTVLLAKAPAGLSRMALTWAMILMGIILISPLYIWEMSTGAHIVLNQNTILAFAYISFFPSVLSFIFWNRGVELVGANVAGSFLNLMPIFGAVLAMVLLGERLQTYHYGGIAFIVAGIYLVTRKKKA